MEQTYHPSTTLRFTQSVCSVLRFIPHERRQKDTHSLTGLDLSFLFDNFISYLPTVYREFFASGNFGENDA